MKRAITYEIDVGITEYMSPEITGFHAALKHRAVDFHVHEVDPLGNTARLEELWTKQRARQDIKEEQSAKREMGSRFGESFVFDIEERNMLYSAFSGVSVDELEAFFQDVRAPYIDVDVAYLTAGPKQSRAAGHKCIKQLSFGELLSSEARTEDGPLKIRVWRRAKERQEKNMPTLGCGKKKKGKGKGKGKHGHKEHECQGCQEDERPRGPTLRMDVWDKPDYLLFKMYKQNRDTAEALASIGKCLRRDAKVFGFAGTKDRKGYTTQFVTAYRCEKDALCRSVLNENWDPSVWVEPVKYVPERLRLGDLFGNRFDVLLRSVDTSCTTEIERAMNMWKQNGFLNYFGMQRFGTKNIGTHEIGAALLRRDYEKCVGLILGDQALLGEQPAKRMRVDESSAAHHKMVLQEKMLAAYYDGEFTRAISHTKSYMFIEISILEALRNHKTDFRAALQQLPHQTLSLYVHAAQSYIYNKALSYRIKTYGRKPRTGDFILPREDFVGASEEVTPQVGEIGHDVSVDQYTLADVVLPLPGRAMKYPEYMREVYDGYAAELGVTLEDFSEFTMVDLKGVYRRICVVPKDVELEIIPASEMPKKYSHIPSDLNRIKQKEEKGADTKVVVEEMGHPGKENEAPAVGANKGGLVVRCSLPASAYVTMALREVVNGGDDPEDD